MISSTKYYKIVKINKIGMPKIITVIVKKNGMAWCYNAVVLQIRRGNRVNSG